MEPEGDSNAVMEKLACRACGAALAADAIDRRLAIVSCGHCGAIFDLTRRRQEGPQSPAPPARKPRAPAALPAKFAVEEDPTRLLVRWRWFTPAAFVLLPLAIAWNGLLVFWYSMALGSGAPEGLGLRPMGRVRPLEVEVEASRRLAPAGLLQGVQGRVVLRIGEGGGGVERGRGARLRPGGRRGEGHRGADHEQRDDRP